MSSVPYLTLNTGASMPQIGLGCWGGVTEETRAAAADWILNALKLGYRHLDTAWIYGTEVSTGKAIKASGIPREEIFVTTKLPWHHGARVELSIQDSLDRLGLDYVDLYLVHFPQVAAFEGDDNSEPLDSFGDLKVVPSPTFVEVWQQMEKVYASGKAKAIGVSNFSIKNLEILLKTAKIVPAANQVEYAPSSFSPPSLSSLPFLPSGHHTPADLRGRLHPYLQQPDLMAYCSSKGIKVIAYTPTGYGTVRSDPTITSLASKYNVMPAQIILGWHVLRGNAAVPKSSDGERQGANLVIPKLTKEDFETVCKLDRNERLCNKANERGKVYGWTYEQLGW
ncbi:hypothetical protein JAAARDRAFT_211958 [Jaapia argillacea MUCL 33604]|uniref:NADP-dependent oxidoreductase domain-containing protein n=1 Tax=Jaapia argillacea MUCL 33604 TaxID=933084 RepID=A0A067PHM5_9AGAM|nr:hypothetical protein JAAARDRAFT_211958 [Jaapia argillacea MUCL 33604]